MDVRTHEGIDAALVGTVRAVDDGAAVVALVTTPAMAADARGLVHGGFVFGLVDYAAMVAVNEPTVVLAHADVRFTAPVVVGDEVVATARVTATTGKRRTIEVVARVGEREVVTGVLTAAVLDDHVLDAGASKKERS